MDGRVVLAVGVVLLLGVSGAVAAQTCRPTCDSLTMMGTSGATSAPASEAAAGTGGTSAVLASIGLLIGLVAAGAAVVHLSGRRRGPA